MPNGLPNGSLTTKFLNIRCEDGDAVCGIPIQKDQGHRKPASRTWSDLEIDVERTQLTQMKTFEKRPSHNVKTDVAPTLK